MLKNALITVSIIATLLIMGLIYLWASNINQKEINRAKLEMQKLRASRDSIKTVVAFKDSLQMLMRTQLTHLQTETNKLRNQVTHLEQNRAKEQLTIRSIRKKQDLQKRFVQTFPEMAQSDWGVTEVMNEEQGVSIEYMLIPLWFSETFIIDHQNSLSYEKQRDKLVSVDSLNREMGSLKDSLLTLEKQKTEAYQNGYTDAYSKYEALNKDYIRVLQKPPTISWGLPQWGMVAAGIGGGILLGTQIK